MVGGGLHEDVLVQDLVNYVRTYVRARLTPTKKARQAHRLARSMPRASAAPPKAAAADAKAAKQDAKKKLGGVEKGGIRQRCRELSAKEKAGARVCCGCLIIYLAYVLIVAIGRSGTCPRTDDECGNGTLLDGGKHGGFW